MSKRRHQLHENPRLWLLVGLLYVLSAFAGTAMAADNLRADSLCIGDKCTTTANDAEIRLEADVVRLRFLDSTAKNTRDDEKIGDSWSLHANDPDGPNNPQTYFSFILRSLDDTPDDGRNNILGKHVLRFGPPSSGNGSANAVAIGLDSEFVEGVVSLGSEHVQRRLVHVAEALKDTDALIKRQLDEGLLGSLGGIADRLDGMEDEVAALERRVASNGGGGGGGGSSNGGGGLVGVPTLVFLAALLGITGWRRTIAA